MTPRASLVNRLLMNKSEISKLIMEGKPLSRKSERDKPLKNKAKVKFSIMRETPKIESDESSTTYLLLNKYNTNDYAG